VCAVASRGEDDRSPRRISISRGRDEALLAPAAAATVVVAAQPPLIDARGTIRRTTTAGCRRAKHACQTTAKVAANVVAHYTGYALPSSITSGIGSLAISDWWRTLDVISSGGA